MYSMHLYMFEGLYNFLYFSCLVMFCHIIIVWFFMLFINCLGCFTASAGTQNYNETRTKEMMVTISNGCAVFKWALNFLLLQANVGRLHYIKITMINQIEAGLNHIIRSWEWDIVTNVISSYVKKTILSRSFKLFCNLLQRMTANFIIEVRIGFL